MADASPASCRGGTLSPEQQLEQALQHREAMEDAGDAAGLARALNHLGVVYVHHGQYRDALERFEESKELFQAVRDSAGHGIALANMAVALRLLGRHAEALKHCQQAAQLLEGGEDLAALSGVLGELGIIHGLLGQHGLALERWRESEELRAVLEATGGAGGDEATAGESVCGFRSPPPPPNTTPTSTGSTGSATAQDVEEMQWLLTTGNELKNTGEYPEALAAYQGLLELAERVGHQQAVGAAHSSLGAVFELLSKYDRALEHYEKSKENHEANGNVKGMGVTLGNMGGAYEKLGKLDLALQQYNRSKEIAEAVHDLPVLSGTLSNMGGVYRLLRQPERALQHYKQAEEIQRRIGDKGGLSRTLCGMGIAHRQLQQHDCAVQLYVRAEEMQRRIGDKTGLAITLMNVGVVHALLGHNKLALENYGKSKEIRESLGDIQGLMHCLHNIGTCHYRDANLQASIDAFTDAFNLTTNHRRQLAAMGSSNVRSLMQGHFKTAIHLQAVLAESGRHTEALHIAEASRAQALDLSLHPPGSTPSTLGGAPAGAKSSIDWQAELAAVPNTVFVVYSLVPNYSDDRPFATEGHLLCWTIGAGPDLAFTSTEASELAALVNLCRHSDLAMRNRASRNVDPTDAAPPPPIDLGGLERGGDIEMKEGESPMDAIRRTQYHPVLTALRKLLIPPALEKLLVGRGFDDDDELNVVFVPTGCLALVPFAALLNPDGAPLIEQCSVATCPSLSHFKKAMAKVDAASASADAGPALLVGNPSPMPKIGGAQLEPLQASKEEVEQLQADLATPTALIGPDATKANLLRLVNGKASSPCILHLATHGHHTDPSGWVAAEHTWDVQGCLAFADAGATTADSFLLARDIAKWRLPATQLAVLSACNSHVGTFQEVKGGTPHDSAAGLSFAFLMAGVPRSLVSLWPVYDFATKELMLHFYRHLQHLNGGGALGGGVLSVAPFTTARALRLATRDLWRDHPDYKRCHLLWSAFVVSGLP